MTEVTKIVQNLIDTTKSDEITWDVFDTIFNKDTARSYSCKSFDGKTIFKIEVRLKDNLDYDYSDLTIRNSALIDGVFFAWGREYEEVNKLGDVIFKKYFKPTIQPKNEKNAFKGILEGMTSTQVIRDRKIDSILGAGKSIFDKILGK
jgi:hypothetical protein